jgi:hypothetical protein
MAKVRKEESQTNGTGKGRIKFRYTDPDRTLDFSMENVAGESVTEGLRSLANALAGQTIVGERRLHKPKPELAAPAIISEEVEKPEPDEPQAELLETETVEQESAEADSTEKPKRVVKPKAPKLLSTPKLTDAKVQLADFMAEKNPTDMMDKYAVVAVWYKEQFAITEITIDHIFTAFKYLGLESKLPTDVAKPLNNLCYGRKWFDKSKTTANTFVINWVGESEVGKMGMAAKSAGAGAAK